MPTSQQAQLTEYRRRRRSAFRVFAEWLTDHNGTREARGETMPSEEKSGVGEKRRKLG